VNTKKIRYPAVLLAVVLGGCATYPQGPSMMVLPGATANFDQFRADEMQCNVYANQALGGQAVQHSAHTGAVNSAAAGTVLGAAAGALLGAASGDAAAGAAIGAGSGLLLGGAAGTEAYSESGSYAQKRYDNAYVQCMYARGHQVPMPASVASAQRSVAVAAPSRGYVPPVAGAPVTASHPPPGLPPPPGY
jgi:hypothetical protein